MATLSIATCIPTCFEIATQPVCHAYSGCPVQPLFQLVVTIPRLFPKGVPCSTVERRRQLSLRPPRISLPETTECITDSVRDIDGLEFSYVAFVLAQELSTRRQVVVHNIENFAIHSAPQPGQRDGLRAV